MDLPKRFYAPLYSLGKWPVTKGASKQTEIKTNINTNKLKTEKTGRQVKQTHKAQTERQTDKKSRKTKRHT
jgi:hypothetical protein